MSVPNQKTITIHQSTEVPFVKLGIREYKEAFRKMPPATFALYLYLAGNMEGFKLELSKAAFENATGYAKSSYHRAYKDLVNLGYIYEDNGHLNFGTSPKIGTRGVVQDWESEVPEMITPIFNLETEEFQERNSTYPEMNTEINNKENRDNRKINKSPSGTLLIEEPRKKGSLDYLYSEVNKYGFHDGVYFDDEITAFWFKPPERMSEFIANETRFSEREAQFIVDNILDTSIISKVKRMELTGDQPKKYK